MKIPFDRWKIRKINSEASRKKIIEFLQEKITSKIVLKYVDN